MMVNRRATSKTSGIHLDEIETQFEGVGQARRLCDGQRMIVRIELHNRGFEVVTNLFDNATDGAQGFILRCAGCNHLQYFVLREDRASPRLRSATCL